MASGLITRYLGEGLAASRPADPDVASAIALYWATDTNELSAWLENAWVEDILGGSGISDGDYGDITVSGAGTTWNIDASAVGTNEIANDAVTFAKIANAAANSKLLGSGASGSGNDYAELSLGTNLSMTGTTLNAAGSAWPLVGTGQTATGIWDATVDGAKANVDFTGLSSYNELLLIYDAVTGSAATANRTIRFSTDNGSTFYTTSGDYVDIATAGTVTNRNAATFQGGTTAASTGVLHLKNTKGAVKSYTSTSTVLNGLFRASASDINAIRVTSTTADTLNGGKIYLYGR